jgi:aminotransferase
MTIAAPLLSKRLRAVGASGGSMLLEMYQRRPGAIALGRGDPDLPAPPHVLAAAQEAIAKGLTRYTPVRGLLELRRAIADKLRRDNGIAADAETDIVVTTGTQEAVFLTFYALLDPGDEVLLPDPYYNAYAPMIRYVEGVLAPVPTRPEQGFRLDPDEVERRITPRTRAIMVVTPNNPSGAVYEPEALERVARIAERRGLFVISDELYEALIYRGRPFSIAALPGIRDRTITINGFSKTYSMTGWRVGYLTASADVVGQMLTLRHALTICAPSVSQHAAIAALRGPQDCLAERLAVFAARRAFVLDRLETLGIPCVPPDGAFYVLVDIRASGMTSEQFALALLEREDVFLYPGSYFGREAEGFVRISLVLPEDVLGEGLSRMRRVIGG